ncbi:MAG: hypothetical protein LBC02_12380 [Planctomycetaceae bacterium]|jgi:hypothetical protein|nr:hypothetical protein [Planctomycetaceae bacterium]
MERYFVMTDETPAFLQKKPFDAIQSINHFALKTKIYWVASKAAWNELEKIKLADGA